MQNKASVWNYDLAKREKLLSRVKIIAAIRSFFQEKDFVEVDTPALQVSPGLEPHLQAFSTELVGPDRKSRTLHLHTSPEFAMKKILVGGWEKIFQIARVFRNGERSYLHHPEFLLLEWYRAHASYRDIMADTEQLVRYVYSKLNPNGSGEITWQGRCTNVLGSWQYITVEEAFAKYAEIDLFQCDLEQEARRLDISTDVSDSWDDVFFRIFLDKIERHLGVGQPTILYDYPRSQAALSEIHPENEKVAQRFEVYLSGMEMANAFQELTDWQEQLRRFEADMDLKEKIYGYRYPIDEDFIAALKQGLPRSSGIALGVDRLIMFLLQADTIEEILWLPVATSEA